MKKDQQPLAAYEVPKVEVIEVEVEKGFVASFNNSDYPRGWNDEVEL